MVFAQELVLYLVSAMLGIMAGPGLSAPTGRVVKVVAVVQPSARRISGGELLSPVHGEHCINLAIACVSAHSVPVAYG